MWEGLTVGLSVLGFTAAITVLVIALLVELLIELPIELAAVVNVPPIARHRTVQSTPAAAPRRRHGGGRLPRVLGAHARAAGRWQPGR
jgi:hypothetical protein